VQGKRFYTAEAQQLRRVVNCSDQLRRKACEERVPKVSGVYNQHRTPPNDPETVDASALKAAKVDAPLQQRSLTGLCDDLRPRHLAIERLGPAAPYAPAHISDALALRWGDDVVLEHLCADGYRGVVKEQRTPGIGFPLVGAYSLSVYRMGCKVITVAGGKGRDC